jgi:RNA polymerase-binding transcription factor DksA
VRSAERTPKAEQERQRQMRGGSSTGDELSPSGCRWLHDASKRHTFDHIPFEHRNGCAARRPVWSGRFDRSRLTAMIHGPLRTSAACTARVSGSTHPHRARGVGRLGLHRPRQHRHDRGAVTISELRHPSRPLHERARLVAALQHRRRALRAALRLYEEAAADTQRRRAHIRSTILAVAEIDDALRRLHHDGYGTCRDCGRRLSINTVTTRPLATQCGLCPRGVRIPPQQYAEPSDGVKQSTQRDSDGR